MAGRLRQVQHRRIADVGAGHDLVPLIAGLGLDDLCQAGPLVGPRITVVAVHGGSVGEPCLFEQLVVELALDRAD